MIETHSATELSRLPGCLKGHDCPLLPHLGYADFDEVPLQAREERNRTQPYAYLAIPARKGGCWAGPSANISTWNCEPDPHLRGDAVRPAARCRRPDQDAPRVWCMGFGAEEGLAHWPGSTFARLRHDVHVSGPPRRGWAEDLSMTGPRDVLILLTLEPRPKVLRQLLAHARTTRMRVITITDHAYAPQAARFSEIVLPCHVASYGILATHSTMLSVLRLIAVAYLGQNTKAVGQRIATLAAIDEELDLFE
jgi:D-arabinose 5-phosphate isomerase GutQ